MAAHSFFLSYSRQEASFVDELFDKLEDDGDRVWLDYESLVPGKPWLGQIFAGIDDAEIFLLVISKSSMASPNVADEYKRALDQKKRIILILFEATSMPVELQSFEWVDFRSTFFGAYDQLKARVEHPVRQEAIPQKGFKAPAIVWASFFTSLMTLLLSIPSWWTLFIPILLAPLPVQILRKRVNYYRVRFALLALPIAVTFSTTFFPRSDFSTYWITCLGCLSSFLIAPIMLILLSSKGMRIWGKPGSSVPSFANPYAPDLEDPEPTPFLVEYAQEDKPYAEAIIAKLTEYHHPQVTDPAQAKVCFSLISRYKNSTSIDPEQHILYPVILQDTQVDDPRIQRIQWIDFRRGLRNLDSLAKLLPFPSKMLKALGVAPIGRQVIYPRIIQIMDYFFVLLGFFWLSIWIPMWLQLGRDIMQLSEGTIFIGSNVVFILLTLTALIFARQGLVSRKGFFASPWTLAGMMFLFFLLSCCQTTYLLSVIDTIIKLPSAPVPANENLRGGVVLFLPLSCGLGFIVIGVITLYNRLDLLRWFPYRGK